MLLLLLLKRVATTHLLCKEDMAVGISIFDAEIGRSCIGIGTGLILE